MHGLQEVQNKILKERERERVRRMSKIPLSDSKFDISSYLKHNLELNIVPMLCKFRRLLKK